MYTEILFKAEIAKEPLDMFNDTDKEIALSALFNRNDERNASNHTDGSRYLTDLPVQVAPLGVTIVPVLRNALLSEPLVDQVMEGNVYLLATDNSELSRIINQVIQRAYAKGIQKTHSELHKQDLAKGRQTLRRQADQYALYVRDVVNKLNRQGVNKLKDVTTEMNKQQIPTYTGEGQWYASSVKRYLNRAKKLSSACI